MQFACKPGVLQIISCGNIGFVKKGGGQEWPPATTRERGVGWVFRCRRQTVLLLA